MFLTIVKFSQCFNGVVFLRRSLQRHTAAIRNKSSISSSIKRSPTEPVPLKHVPALPFLGSLLQPYSGITIDLTNPSGTWLECRKKYGDFYTIGIPNIGAGIYGTLHIVNDPHEMQKVLRSEGKFPTSSVMDLWTFRQFQDDYGKLGRAGEILGYGEDWKLVRSFMQTDLLAPQSANRYLPGILEATRFISKGMPRHSH